MHFGQEGKKWWWEISELWCFPACHQNICTPICPKGLPYSDQENWNTVIPFLFSGWTMNVKFLGMCIIQLCALAGIIARFQDCRLNTFLWVCLQGGAWNVSAHFCAPFDRFWGFWAWGSRVSVQRCSCRRVIAAKCSQSAAKGIGSLGCSTHLFRVMATPSFASWIIFKFCWSLVAGGVGCGWMLSWRWGSRFH